MKNIPHSKNKIQNYNRNENKLDLTSDEKETELNKFLQSDLSYNNKITYGMTLVLKYLNDGMPDAQVGQRGQCISRQF